jgi:hypothetical protein
MNGFDTLDLTSKAKSSLSPLFNCTHDTIQEWEKGEYGVIYARPSKRMKAVLDVQREILCLVSSYTEQQARTTAFAKRAIKATNGRLEQNVCIIIHRDSRGNSKLKKWGRETGISIIPIYVSSDYIPSGKDLEKALAYEFFTQDPFDITGPVASDAQFFGRRTEAQELARKLQNGQIRSCFGIRKIGKTSVMHRVLKEIEENFECKTVFSDCQKDSIFELNAAQLLMSFAHTLESAKSENGKVFEIRPWTDEIDIAEASKIFLDRVALLNVPVILAFDEIDYISPGSPTASHWHKDFIPFWRNVRAAYQSAGRSEQKLSILVCGVSSKWFSVESIDGLENAALAFVPEEYLSPLPRGASVAMIKSVGPIAGLQFEEKTAELIAGICSDMPFWIRKACSFLHERTDTSIRPLVVTVENAEPIIRKFIDDEGASMARVALQHLFRVYPDLKRPCQLVLIGKGSTIQPSILRVLCKYGISTTLGSVSGELMRAGLELIDEDSEELDFQPLGSTNQASLQLEISDWAEELQIISRRRNLIERKLREIVFNFIRMSCLSNTQSMTPKDAVLSSLPEKRRKELASLTTDQISTKIFWLEIYSIIRKHWSLFEKIFGDQQRLQSNIELVNDRPDTHAKDLDLADVALYRRSLTWFDDCLAKVG